MAVDTQVKDNIAKILMSGRFDFQIHREFKEAYTRLLEAGSIRQIEVDMSKLEYLDSSALGMLMLLNERAKALNCAVILVNPSSVVNQVLEVANFHRLFTIKRGA